jgi:hypothetical protein
MARAATKRNQGARKTARAVASDQPRARKKKEKTLEDELFFNRLRGHAKWAFVLLAVVFATSFVFLGVGSGNAGLSDVFSNIFGGGSGSSISSLQKKVAENPKSQQAVVDLALALGRDGRTEEAIGAYRTYLDEKPRDTVVLGNLAILYQQLASTAANDANAALRASALAAPAAQFRPGSGALGNALGSFVGPGRAGLPGGSRSLPRREQGLADRLQAADRTVAERAVRASALRAGGRGRGRVQGVVDRLPAVRQALPDRLARAGREAADRRAEEADRPERQLDLRPGPFAERLEGRP